MVALKKGLRSPFEPADELHPNKKDEPAKPAADAAKPAASPKTASCQAKVEKVEIDLDGIAARLLEVPVPPGNYSNLAVAGKRLCWIDANAEDPQKSVLQCLDIANKGDKPDTLLEGVNRFEVSGDGKKMLIAYKQNELLIVDAAVKGAALKDPKTLADSQVDLKSWTFSVIPSDEFHEAFLDAWRLHRDYFYDRNMHGVNWAAMRDKYGELVGRVRDREELSDLIAEMVSELSALHASVSGGDIRRGPDQVALAALGARLVRDAKAGGYLVEHIYQSDPDRPDRKSPLAQPGVDIAEGDVLLAVNGSDLLVGRRSGGTVAQPGGQAGADARAPERQDRAARRHREAGYHAAGSRPALRRMGVHAAAGGGPGVRRARSATCICAPWDPAISTSGWSSTSRSSRATA